jgi:hypothetical protein
LQNDSEFTPPHISRYPTEGHPSKGITKEKFQHQKLALGHAALRRVAAVAKDTDLLERIPAKWIEANQWLVEMAFGKPSIQIDQRVTGRIVLTPDDLALIQPGDDTALLSEGVIDADYAIMDAPTMSNSAPEITKQSSSITDIIGNDNIATRTSTSASDNK